MSILDQVPAHPDDSPIVIEWTSIKDGLKWKTVFLAEKAAYMERNSIESLTDEKYVMICMVDQFKEYKKAQSMLLAQESIRQQFLDQKKAIEDQTDEIKIEDI